MKIIVSLENLESSSKIIADNANVSMEGISDALPNFFSDVKNFIGDVFDFSKNPISSLLDGHGFLGKVKQTNYTDLMNLTIHVPMGYHGRLVEYIDALKKAQHISELLIREVLNPFNVWIGLNLADPSRLIGFTNGHNIVGLKFHDIESVRKIVAKHIDSGSPVSEVSFGSVFSRNQDWIDAVRDLNELVGKAATIKNGDITNIVATISKNLDELLEKIKSDPINFKTSPSTIKAISTVCYTMAKECEFYAFYRHLLTNLQLSMLETEKVLKGKIEADKVSKA